MRQAVREKEFQHEALGRCLLKVNKVNEITSPCRPKTTIKNDAWQWGKMNFSRHKRTKMGQKPKRKNANRLSDKRLAFQAVP